MPEPPSTPTYLCVGEEREKKKINKFPLLPSLSVSLKRQKRMAKREKEARKWCDRICMNKHLADHSNRSCDCGRRRKRSEQQDLPLRSPLFSFSISHLFARPTQSFATSC